MGEREQKLVEVVKRVLDVEEISLDTRKEDVEEWDSLKHLNLVLEIEEEFGVSIPLEKIGEIETVRDFLKFLEG